MGEQDTLSDDDSESYYYIFYREIQSDSSELTEERFTGEAATSIETLLDDVFDSTGGTHILEELDTTSYFQRWIEGCLSTSGEIDPGDDVNKRTENDLEAIAEDFSDDMKTRARAKGKYVVLIMGKERLIACHSYTGKRALTTDMDVVEELLSAANIDKYAEFRREGEETEVNHFDKYDTESFVEWLGIPMDEVVYDIKGDVKIYSEIGGGVQTTFRFTRDDIVEKIINSDDFKLEGNLLETPNSEKNYRIKRIRWGNSTYETAEEFKQEALTSHYELTYYEDEYENLASGDLDLFTKTAIDRQNKLTIRSDGEEVTRVTKDSDDFEVVFVNEYIDLETGWRQSLASRALGADERIPIHHPGNDVTDTALEIGALRIYNDVGLDDEVVDDIQDLVRTARDIGASNVGSTFRYIIFDFLEDETSEPISHFFGELAEVYLQRHQGAISEGSRVTVQEGGPASVELKSAEWFYVDKDRQLVGKIAEELDNGAGILVGGIDENGGKVKTIQKNRFPHDRLESIERRVENESEAEQVRVIPIPLDGGDLTIAAMRTG